MLNQLLENNEKIYHVIKKILANYKARVGDNFDSNDETLFFQLLYFNHLNKDIINHWIDSGKLDGKIQALTE